jgi:hypothetical protein
MEMGSTRKALATAALVSFLAAGELAWAAPSMAHGGYPVRLGVRQGPDLALLAQLVLVYLVDGQGMNIHPTFFDADADLGKEYASGRIDLFLDMPAGERLGAGCEGGDERAYFEEFFPGSWLGPFSFTVGASPCARPTLVAHSKVAADLRFTLLQGTLEKLLAAVTLSDLERLREEGESGPRDAAAAARRLLKRKDLL